MKLNRAKCVFGVKEIKYVGHIFSHEGLQVDPSQIEATVNMPVPENTSDVHRFLGMITYLGRFIPTLSSTTSELRKLLREEKAWEWSKRHSDEFQNLQKCITNCNSPVLQYFIPGLPIKLSVDASKEGLGAVLLQMHDKQWRPVTYASRVLNSSEQNYSQIEKETLAVVFSTEHFNEYVYGARFVVESDHKPLQSIFQRNKAPPRIQRMLLRLQKYDIELQFTPGTDIPIADALSRASLSSTSSSTLDY